MAVADNSVCDQSFGFIAVTKGECNRNESEDDDRNQVTPEQVLNSLPRYVIRSKGAYLNGDNLCGICYSKYNVGDRVICLPCQHNFHEYCIENWLKWVKLSCPIDKKSVVWRKYMDDVVNKRRHQLLGINANHETNAEICTAEKDNPSTAAKQADIFLTSSPHNVLGKSHAFKTVGDDDEAANICTTMILPPEDGNSETPTDNHLSSADLSPKKLEIFCYSNDYKCNEKSRRSRKESSRKSSLKIRDSVGAIRKSLRAERSKIKTTENFDLALDKAMDKLSIVNIYSPKNTPDIIYKNENLIKTTSSVITSKCKVTEQATNREGAKKRIFTFRELSEIENKKKSGWTYTRNKQVVFARNRSK